MKSSLLKGGASDEMLWNLVRGPLDFLWIFVRMETACSLQAQWEERVLAETQGISEQDAMKALLSQEGPVWRFVKEAAAPFIGWRAQEGYYAKRAFEGTIPFNPAFLTFLTKGTEAKSASLTKQSGYNVLIKGLPTDSNPEALLKPHSTRLELQCTSGTHSLINLQYPISKTFVWSPEACSDVLFEIEIGKAVLSRKYSGQRAFPEFLQDFENGQHTFYPQDFPDDKTYLDSLRIKYIKVNYKFSGHQAVLQQFALPEQIPKDIAQCWDR
jgi:type VI secretion system protein ImpL